MEKCEAVLGLCKEKPAYFEVSSGDRRQYWDSQTATQNLTSYTQDYIAEEV